jgi:hypothetical protein
MSRLRRGAAAPEVHELLGGAVRYVLLARRLTRLDGLAHRALNLGHRLRRTAQEIAPRLEGGDEPCVLGFQFSDAEVARIGRGLPPSILPHVLGTGHTAKFTPSVYAGCNT